MSISVLILTLNEEQNLERCLQSLAWSDDVVVLDSFSTDQTEAIARRAGVRFLRREFDSYSGQRNFGLKETQYINPWVLMVDADETVPPELVEEMLSAARNATPDVCLFRMRRKDFLMGRWIRRSSGYPTWFGRLARVGRVWVEREINEEYHTDGQVRTLDCHLHHYPFNKGFGQWLEKHNRYSTMESKKLIESGAGNVVFGHLFARDPQMRRVVLKRMFYAMPLRPLVAFLGLYIVKGGALEGRAGLIFCALRAVYEFMIDIKVDELRLRRRNLPL